MNELTLGLAQIAPVWLNRDKTLEKVLNRIEEASKENCNLVAFGEPSHCASSSFVQTDASLAQMREILFSAIDFFISTRKA